MKFLYLWIPLLWLSACGRESRESDLKDASIPGDNQTTALVGQGYDVDKQTFLRPCVTGKLVYAGSPQASIQLDRKMTYDQLMSELGINISGKANFEVFDVSGSTKFAIKAATTRFRDSMIFKAEVLGRNALLSDITLNDYAKGVVGSEDAIVRARCGTDFVEQIQLGGKLLISVSLEFANEALKTEFEANAKFSMVSLFEVEGGLKVTLDHFKENVSITINALQIGGQVDQLASILNSEDGSNGLYFLKCSLENREACAKTLQKIITYASETFPDQLKNLDYDPTRSSGPAFLSYKTRSYHSYGLTELYPKPSPILAADIEQTRRDIIRQYHSLAKHWDRAQDLLQVFRLTKDERDRVQGIANMIAENKAKIVRVGQLCFEKPMACVDEAAKLHNAESPEMLKTYDPDGLVKELQFYDYCMMDKANPMVQKTVKALKNAIRMPDSACEAVEAELTHVTTLDLSGKDLQVLSPLGSFSQLKTLNLKNNKIINLDSLTKLSKLKCINLSQNNVDHLDSLGKIPSLEDINISYNRVDDLTPLSGLSNLKTLKIHGNNITDQTQIEGMRKLTSLKTFHVTETDACRSELDFLLNNQAITQSDYKEALDFDLAPYYKDGYRSLTVRDWYVCSLVVRGYE